MELDSPFMSAETNNKRMLLFCMSTFKNFEIFCKVMLIVFYKSDSF